MPVRPREMVGHMQKPTQQIIAFRKNWHLFFSHKLLIQSNRDQSLQSSEFGDEKQRKPL